MSAVSAKTSVIIFRQENRTPAAINLYLEKVIAAANKESALRGREAGRHEEKMIFRNTWDKIIMLLRLLLRLQFHQLPCPLLLAAFRPHPAPCTSSLARLIYYETNMTFSKSLKCASPVTTLQCSSTAVA